MFRSPYVKCLASLSGGIVAMIICTSICFAQATVESLIKDMRWRNIGPANMSGRISDIEALDDDFTHVVTASASGGVWKSINAGTTWEPIFDNYGAASIGDIAVFQPNPDIIWVGTGEECGRNSAAWGDGIYKSTDGGGTFTNMGLEDTYTIGTVLVHPTDPDLVYVAAAGCIWGYIGSRGFFRSTDGGENWEKLTNGLPDDGKSGAIEAIMHPHDPDIIYVAFWPRLRQPFRMDSGGPNGGIFKSTDGGDSWTRLTEGLPEGDSGKIGLAISRSNPDVLMAYYEHGYQPTSRDPDYEDMTRLGSGMYRSEDGGESWIFVNRYQNRPFYYSHVWINPFDDQLIYRLTGGFQYSEDGGRTWQRFRGEGIHSDYHALWLDPNNRDRFYVGNDGGCYLTHDHGDSFIMFNNFCISQFYMIGVDMQDPYYVYGGLQDNGTWGGPSASRDRWIYTDLWYTISGGDGYHAQVDPTDWRIVYSEPHPGNTGGRIQRENVETRQDVQIRPQKGENIVNYDEYITPEIEALQLEKGWGESPGNGSGAFRWNWSSPIVLSPHNPRTVYFGANHLFKSIDRGDTWHLISPDLSKNDPYKTIKESGGLTPDHNPGGGAEFHGTIITISESPIKAGLIWVGTDDGNVQVTRNGGVDWENVRDSVRGVPEDLWVSRVEASHFAEGTCYLTFDGHRSANFQPWVFKTVDYGESWINITNNLPDGQPVYVIREDLKNPNLLFVGTEFAVFISINGGESWARLNLNMPTVAFHDLVIHPRENDLIAGTHGRGIWVLDDITPLQQATEEVLASDAWLFENRPVTQWLSIRTGGSGGSLYFRGENPDRDASLHYFIGDSVEGAVGFQITDISGMSSWTHSTEAVSGINRLEWNMRFDLSAAEVGPVRDRMFQSIDRFLEDITGRQARQVNRLRDDLERAGSDVAKIKEIWNELISLSEGSRMFRSSMLQGSLADPGEYLVTMTCDGKSYTSTLVIRPDPMLMK
jgi:photosystem II stability/assembly factor-like uncharacterized protein